MENRAASSTCLLLGEAELGIFFPFKIIAIPYHYGYLREIAFVLAIVGCPIRLALSGQALVCLWMTNDLEIFVSRCEVKRIVLWM